MREDVRKKLSYNVDLYMNFFLFYSLSNLSFVITSVVK